MTSRGFREEVLNVLLAQLLTERGIVSTPEQILKSAGQERRMPDVLVVFRGLRTVIEGKVDDLPGAEQQVLQDASARVEQGIAHIGIAVLYPAQLRHAASVDMAREQLSKVGLRVAVCSEASEAAQQGWTACDLDYLGELLRRTFDQLVEEDIVSDAVTALGVGVDRFAQALTLVPAALDRWADVLGIREPDQDKAG